MARRRVTVEVKRAGVFEDAVEFFEADGHHVEVGHHLVFVDERAERSDHAGDVAAVHYKLVIGLFGGRVLVPRVFERGDLRFGIDARLVAEQYVVIPVGI